MNISEKTSAPKPVQAPRLPTNRQRVLSLILGPLYIFYHALALSSVSKISLGIALSIILVAVAIILTVFSVISVLYIRNEGPTPKFPMATVLLIFVPFSIYLGTIKWFVQATASETTPPASTIMWISGIAWSIFWMAFTTTVLLYFGEALAWLALKLYRFTSLPRKL